MSLALYIATHNQPIEQAPANTVPIQVGATLTDQRLCPVTDDSGINISSKNREFCELTALYWIWKNDTHDTVGLSHYRRTFQIDTDTIPEILTEHDIIIPPPYYFRCSLRDEYEKHHIISDLSLLSATVERLYPEMSTALRDVLSRNMLIPYNMFITKRECLEDYCRVLFEILFSMESSLNCQHRSSYQRRVFGFLAERIFTAYVLEKELNTYTCPVSIPENQRLTGRLKYCCGSYFNRFYFQWISKKA